MIAFFQKHILVQINIRCPGKVSAKILYTYAWYLFALSINPDHDTKRKPDRFQILLQTYIQI